MIDSLSKPCNCPTKGMPPYWTINEDKKKGGERIEVHLARLSIRFVEDILPAPSKLCGLASVVQCIQIVRSGIGETNVTVG